MANVQSEITSPKALFSSYQQLISQGKAHKQQLAEDAKRQQDFVDRQSLVEKKCQSVRHLEGLEMPGIHSERLTDLLRSLGMDSNLNQVYKKYVDDDVLAEPEIAAAINALHDQKQLQDLCAELKRHDAERGRLKLQIKLREKVALNEATAQKEAEAAELVREQLRKEQALAAKSEKQKSLKKKLVLTSIFIGGIIAFVKFQ